MTNPAEKIRQVVKDIMDSNGIYPEPNGHISNGVYYTFFPHQLDEVVVGVVDAIIEEMELRKDEKLYESTKLPPPNDMAAGYNGAMTEWIWKLKEARNSLTNITHE